MTALQRFTKNNGLSMPTPFSSLFDEMLRPFGVGDIALGSTWSTAPAIPAAPLGIRETADEYIVECDLPGVDAKDIGVEIEDNVVTLKAVRNAQNEQTTARDGYQYSERSYGSYERAFRLPKLVDASKATAGYDRGVLTLRLPKHEEAKPKSVQVRVQQP